MLCSWAGHLTLTVRLSTQVYKCVSASCWGDLTNCEEVTCDGPASRPGEVEILLAASCYRNQDKFRQLWASLGSKASLFFLILLLAINVNVFKKGNNFLWVNFFGLPKWRTKVSHVFTHVLCFGHVGYQKDDSELVIVRRIAFFYT